jgi:hypothetical protein
MSEDFFYFDQASSPHFLFDIDPDQYVNLSILCSSQLSPVLEIPVMDLPSGFGIAQSTSEKCFIIPP